MATRPKTPQRPARAAPGEARFLAEYDASRYPHPSLTVDVVFLTVNAGRLSVLLVQRDAHPFKGRFALPGGFVGIDEGLEEAAARVLESKCGLSDVFLEQLATFGAPKRDPRTRVVSVVYIALVNAARFPAQAAAPQSTPHTTVGQIAVDWEGERGGPARALGARDGQRAVELPLAFDHADILGVAVKRLRGKLDYTPVGFQLLPEKFTLFELQEVHETVLGRSLNKDSFRRRMLGSGELEATGEAERGVGHRPAELYRFRAKKAV